MFWNHVVTSGLTLSLLLAGPALAASNELQGSSSQANPTIVAQSTTPTPPKVLQKDKVGDTTAMPEAQSRGPSEPDPMSPSPDRIVGQPLYNLSGEEIAQIDGVFIDPNTQRDAVVLSYGGFLGIGDRQVTVPYEKITVTNDKLVTDLTLEALDRMPEYQPHKTLP